MLLSQVPLRVSLLGGGSDLPEYFETGREGIVIGMAIKKYIYVYSNTPKIIDKSIVKYSKSESFDDPEELSHPLFKVALQKLWPKGDKIELASFADIKSGTGLGSSSAFSVALIANLSSLINKKYSPYSLVKQSFEYERKILKEPIGLQDSAFAAFGGCSKFRFSKGERLEHSSINLDEQGLTKIREQFFLVFTKKSRDAIKSLKHHTKSLQNDDKIKLQEFIVSLVNEGKDALENNDFKKLGELVLESYKKKKSLIDNGKGQKNIDFVEELLAHHSIWGYKLLGAGGGGFFLVIGKPIECFNYLNSLKLDPIPVEIDQFGCRIININN